MQLNAFRYRFPFISPFKTGNSTYAEREGIIFILEADGIRAFGEAAPLPGFSRESLDEVVQELEQKRNPVHDFIRKETENPGTPKRKPDTPLTPALAFALDTLVYDFRGKRKRQPLHKMMFKDFQNSIPLNATLGLDSDADFMNRAQKYWKEGYRTFKVKTGRNFEHELERIRQLREAFPASRIRIDANQSWELNEAESNLGRLETLDIEYCEEPLQNPVVDKLHLLQKKISIPIALDEFLHQPGFSERLIRQKAGNIIIIKPMVIGSFKKIFETYRLAVTHDYIPVFTTSLESGIGRMMTAILASGLGSPRFAHGLATGSLLSMDVWHDRAYIDNGHFVLSDGYGLGEERRPEIQDLALEPIVF